MSLLRLAYSTLFLIALIAVFVLWSEVGGQVHLDIMPWYLKLGLGGGAAFACVKATAAAVEGKQAWNGRTLRWGGIALVLLLCCGLASYYYHLYGESDDEDNPDGDEDAPAAVVPSAVNFEFRARATQESGHESGELNRFRRRDAEKGLSDLLGASASLRQITTPRAPYRR